MKPDEAFERVRAVLAGRAPRTIEDLPFERAGVLLPVIARPDGAAILFTRRAETVGLHKGQISFPGGRREPGEDARGNALRETWEEVGIEPRRVEVAGVLDDQLAVTRFVVTPVVGLIADPPAEYRPQVSEVALSFEVPLARLLDPQNVRRELWDLSRMPPGAPVEELRRSSVTLEEVDPATGRFAVYFFDGGDGRVIWGLTARILKQFLELAFGYAGLAG